MSAASTIAQWPEMQFLRSVQTLDDFNKGTGKLWVSIMFLPGTSFRRVPAEGAVVVGEQLFISLGHAHSAGVVAIHVKKITYPANDETYCTIMIQQPLCVWVSPTVPQITRLFWLAGMVLRAHWI